MARNLVAQPGRAARWRPARDALWGVLDRHVTAGASVAVVGAGSAHDLPLTRLLARAGAVDLIDLQRAPCRRALRRKPAALRVRGRALRGDVTGGAADRIARAVMRGRRPRGAQVPVAPIGRSRYDAVVGDLLYTQLLHPALLDARLSRGRMAEALELHGQTLCDGVVERLHSSAAGGVVIHVDDVLGWWSGHQPTAGLGELLRTDPEDMLSRVRAEHGPRGCDIDSALETGGHPVIERVAWGWPFADTVDYLVQATVSHGR